MAVPKSTQTRIGMIEITEVQRSWLLFPHPIISVVRVELITLKCVVMTVYIVIGLYHFVLNAYFWYFSSYHHSKALGF